VTTAYTRKKRARRAPGAEPEYCMCSRPMKRLTGDYKHCPYCGRLAWRESDGKWHIRKPTVLMGIKVRADRQEVGNDNG